MLLKWMRLLFFSLSVQEAVAVSLCLSLMEHEVEDKWQIVNLCYAQKTMGNDDWVFLQSLHLLLTSGASDFIVLF